MLGNSKEHHRLEFAIIVEQFNVSCSDVSKVNDINNLCLQLSYYGSSKKESIKTECISNRKCINPENLQYSLSWKHQPVLNFHIVLTKRKGCYERLKKPPELFLALTDGYGGIIDDKLGSTKLELHEHANNKEAGQTYDEEDKIVINLRNKKRLYSCELLVRYRIPDVAPSVVDDFASSRVSPAITPSVSCDTINSLDTRTLTHRTLKQPIFKLLNEVYLIGVDNNRYVVNWSQMHLIFFVFGTMPDVIEKFSDFVNTLGEAPVVGEHVAVVHICQGDLAATDVLYPYLPREDEQNPAFHDLFHIPSPHSDHPKICVVNKKLTEYYVVESYEIEKYLEERNPLELYYLWNYWPVPSGLQTTSRSQSLQEEASSSPQTDLSSMEQSASSHKLLHHGELNSSFEGSSLPYSSRSSVKAMKPTETSEYKALQSQLASTTDKFEELHQKFLEVQQHMSNEKKHNDVLCAELEKFKILEIESQKMIEKCQKENIFFRHQVLLRGNLALRSGTFNLFKTRWFQLESASSQQMCPVISFYNGPDRLGQIVLGELISYETLSGTQFKVVTKFAEYVLNAESAEESTKWISGINTLYRSFCSKQTPFSNTRLENRQRNGR